MVGVIVRRERRWTSTRWRSVGILDAFANWLWNLPEIRRKVSS